MRKTLKLIPALCMLLISAMMLGTTTYAWFSMSGTVRAYGMNVKALGEEGIVITNEARNPEWKIEAEASHTGIDLLNASSGLFPTNTSNGTTWYHNTSSQYDNAEAGKSDHLTLSTTTSNGLIFDTNGTYVLYNQFFVKSSKNAVINTPFYLQGLKVVATGGSSAVLDKSLRVAIRVTDQSSHTYFKIFTPFYTGGGNWQIGSNSLATYTAEGVGSSGEHLVNYNFGSVVIPDNSATNSKTSALFIEVYIYFEGEDENCKSSNLTDRLNNLNVEMKFGTGTISAY